MHAVGIRYGLPPIIDPIASLIVAVFILRAAFQIIRSTSAVLVDKAVADSEQIRSITLEFSEVHDVHDIRSRGTDQELFIDMHVLIDPDMGIADSHRLCHAVEQRICQKLQRCSPGHDSHGTLSNRGLRDNKGPQSF